MSKYIAILFLFILAIKTFGQGITTGAISGITVDQEQKPLSGVTIFAINQSTGTKYVAISNRNGRFYILGMRIGGPYVVTASLIGYSKEVKEDVFISLNQSYDLTFILKQGNIRTNEIEVIADKSNIFSSLRTGASQYVSAKEIENLPTVARSIHDYSRLSPLIVSSTIEGSSVVGRNSKYNNIQIDGSSMNDCFGLYTSGTPGGGAGAEPISLDAVQEFQVLIAPFDVRQGNFTGGLINAITKSGSNDFIGSIYFYGYNSAFVGKGATDIEIPDFNEMNTGFRIGGPIFKDQLFFFISGEYKNRKDPFSIGINDPNKKVNFAVPESDILRVDSITRFKYGYDPGTYKDYTRITDDIKIFLRLDFNISDKHRMMLRHNFVKASQGNDVLRNWNELSFSGQEYIFKSIQNQTVLQLNSIFSNNLANEFRISYTSISDLRDPVSSKPFPSVKINNLGADQKRSLSFGIGRFAQANSLDQTIIEITDNLSYQFSNHILTIGTHNELVKFDNLFLQDYFGTWEFNSIDDYLNGKASRYYLSYSLLPDSSAPRAKFNYIQLSLYAQDQWSILNNLNITFGIRADLISYTEMPLFNQNLYDSYSNELRKLRTDEMPTPFSFSPRIGFNYDIFNDRTTQIRGGIGVFTGRTPGVWISNQYSNTGVDIARIDLRNPSYVFSPDPHKQPKTLNSITTEINIIDKNFKMPQILRTNLAIDRQLPLGFYATFELIYSKNIYDVYYQNKNIRYSLNPDGSIQRAFDGRPLYKGQSPAAVVDSNFTSIIYLTNTTEGTQTSFTIQLQKPYKTGIFPNLSANVAYTFSNSKDVINLNSSRAISNWQYNPSIDPNEPVNSTSFFDIPHRIIANLSYTLEYGSGFATTIGFFYEGRSGVPFSFVYYTNANAYIGDANNDNVWNNDLCYIPSSEEDIILTPKSDDPNSPYYNNGTYAELEAFLNQFEELKDQRGHICKRNSLRQPWRNQLDLRITQDIPTFSNQKIQLTLDVLNFLNLLNSEWGQQKYISFGNYGLLQFEGYDAISGKLKASYKPKGSNSKEDIWEINDFWSRWQMQFGIRYSF